MGNLFIPGLEIRQKFRRYKNSVRRTLDIGSREHRSFINATSDAPEEASKAWFIAALRGGEVTYPSQVASMTLADLYCGAGGLTYGVQDAANAMGIEIRPRLAIDLDAGALDIYQRNIGVDAPLVRDVKAIIDYHVTSSGLNATFAYSPAILDPLVKDLAHGIDIVVAGPPCQGHSNLNNKTRRNDARNLLYLTAPAFAIAAKARLLIIENVPDVLNDAHNVVTSARALLVKAGYSISETVLAADRFGLPQTRRRHFLVAVKNTKIEFHLSELASSLEVPMLGVGDALSDLFGKEGETKFHSASDLSLENRKRIDWLFDNGEDDLANHVRPLCHRNGHTYPSVYGRLKLDQPAGTITTGFLTPGRGRYTHPMERRGLTPHEGARLQGFPDTFTFNDDARAPSKKLWSKVIGDAVPATLGFVIGVISLALVQAR